MGYLCIFYAKPLKNVFIYLNFLKPFIYIILLKSYPNSIMKVNYQRGLWELMSTMTWAFCHQRSVWKIKLILRKVSTHQNTLHFISLMLCSEMKVPGIVKKLKASSVSDCELVKALAAQSFWQPPEPCHGALHPKLKSECLCLWHPSLFIFAFFHNGAISQIFLNLCTSKIFS